MRTKATPVMYLDFSGTASIKISQDYRSRYEAISDILDANPQLLALAHRDWSRLLSTSHTGRGGYTSEQLLRALLVMFIEGGSYRDTVIRIDTSEFLQYFVRLGIRPTMDYTFLNKAFCTLSDRTLERMNALIARYARDSGQISGDRQRMDSTVYETNIHYPTDSSLLWDSFRTLSRQLGNIQKELPQLDLHHRYHDRKVRKRATYIARNASSTSRHTQRQVKQQYRALIASVRWIHGIGVEVLGRLTSAGYHAASLSHYLPLVERIVDQAYQRVIEGKTVPPDEKLYSLFEEHTELLKRGKAGKPIEFGHKILLAQTGEKFIHHYQVLARRVEDKDLLDAALAAHKELFAEYPTTLAADKGFYENMDRIGELEQHIATVSIAKKGRRTQDEYDRETSEAFVDGQRFRAGVEGSISVLKRAFKLGRCFFKGFTHYAASVGLAVLCHNLVLLTRL